MDNPVSTVTNAARSAVTVSNVLKLLFGLVLLMAILDFLKLTAWVVQPYTTAMAKWGKRAATLIVFAVAAAATATNWLFL